MKILMILCGAIAISGCIAIVIICNKANKQRKQFKQQFYTMEAENIIYNSVAENKAFMQGYNACKKEIIKILEQEK